MSNPSPIERRALISGPFRYALYRRWGASENGVTFVMLNPSTADGDVDDPTIRRCIGFARGWAFGSLSVVNLYALRATNPADLMHAADPVGPENAEWIATACQGAAVVLAWGACIGPRPPTVRAHVAEILFRARSVDCLGYCANGQPRHPLYVRAAQERVSAAASIRATFGL